MARVDVVKWIATVIQLIGYGLTGLNVVPWNILAFVVGIALWFVVGVMWKDQRNYGGSYRCVHRDCRWLSEFVILGAQNRMARGCGKGLTIGLQTMLMQP